MENGFSITKASASSSPSFISESFCFFSSVNQENMKQIKYLNAQDKSCSRKYIDNLQTNL